jgi:hypothetical protein
MPRSTNVRFPVQGCRRRPRTQSRPLPCVKNGERSPDELILAQRDLVFANVADYIQKTVAAAPPFTPEQVDRLRVLLEPARREPIGGAA